MDIICKKTYPLKTFTRIITLLENRGYIIDELDNLSTTQVEHLEKCFDDLIYEYNIDTFMTAEDLMGIAPYYEDRGCIYIKWIKDRLELEEAKNIVEDFYQKTKDLY